MNQRQKVSLSIIVPVYNVEKYLKTCVESLLDQTIDDYEIILVDDGSTDQSGKMCDRYAGQYSNIAVVHRENGGLGFARNSGLDVAKGEYVGFVDSDDFVHQRMFEILLGNARQHDADASYGVWKRFSKQEDTNRKEPIDKLHLQVWNGEKEIYDYLLDRIGLAPKEARDNLYGASVCGGIFRRKIIEENKIRFVSERQFIAEDMIFDIDFIMCCAKVVHCDGQLYYYRYNPVSLTTTYKPNRFSDNIVLYEEMIRRMRQKYAEQDMYYSLSRYFLTFTRIAILQEMEYLSYNGYKKAKENINTICQNEKLQSILSKYPIAKLPLKFAIFCYCERKKYVNVLILLTWFNKKRKQGTF